MKVWIENEFEGTVEFVEGEVDKEKKPTFFVLAKDKNGLEKKIFFQADSVDEHTSFLKDIELILRH